MTDPQQIPELPEHLDPDLARYERELLELGWRPVAMRDPDSGAVFNRWFPPGKPIPAEYREFLTEKERQL